jgi:hypothetical protein
MSGKSLTYHQYLESLPAERRTEVDKVWRVVRKNMPEGYIEDIGPKFISFKADADWYVALASQKNYISLYLMPVYVFPELKTKLDDAVKNLKCGKSCINFKKAEDLPLDIVGEIIAANDAEAYKEHVRRVRAEAGNKRKAGSKK